MTRLTNRSFALLFTACVLYSPAIRAEGHGRQSTVVNQRFNFQQVVKNSRNLGTWASKNVGGALGREFLSLGTVKSVIGKRSRVARELRKGVKRVAFKVGAQLRNKGNVAVDPKLARATSWNHASYVANEFSRDYGIPERKTRDVVFKAWEKIRQGELAAPNDAKTQRKVAMIVYNQLRSSVPKAKRSALFSSLMKGDNSWMIGGRYGPMTQALNVTGPVAKREMVRLATAIGGSRAAGERLLSKVAGMTPRGFASAVQNPTNELGLLAAATVLYNKAAYSTSKYVQGGVKALAALQLKDNPQKRQKLETEALKRWNDQLTNLSFKQLLAAPDAAVQLPKDQAQLKGSLLYRGTP